MKPDDKEFLKEFLSGAMLPVGILGVVVLLDLNRRSASIKLWYR